MNGLRDTMNGSFTLFSTPSSSWLYVLSVKVNTQTGAHRRAFAAGGCLSIVVQNANLGGNIHHVPEIETLEKPEFIIL